MATVSVDRRYRVDVDTGELIPVPGASMSPVCPRAGGMLLGKVVPGTTYERRVRMDTNCKTWRCLGCRDRMMALFKARVITGVLRLGRCAFMTVTYKEGSRRLEDAGCVAADWRELSRQLGKESPQVKKLHWLRVMELTKKGTPHHHLVVGSVEGHKIRCWGSDGFDVRSFRRRFGSCDCLAHEYARSWWKVTGDSWIVHGMPVSGARRAGAYLAKYMGKVLAEGRLESVGMSRRWSSSRGWPGRGRLRLAQTTKEGGWDRTAYKSGHWDDDVVGGPEDLLVRDGDNLTEALSVEAGRRRFVGTFKIEEEL